MADVEIIQIPKKQERIVVLTVAGEGMLHNRMTQEAKDIIKGIAKGGDKKDYSVKPKQWPETLHRTPSGHIGFPAEAFTKACGDAMKGVDLSKKKLFRGQKNLYQAMHVESDEFDTDGNGIVLYDQGTVTMLEHMAVLQGKTPIPIYRALISNWQMTLGIAYNAAMLTPEDIYLLVDRAGSGIGVGAFRPEHRGPYGTFHIVKGLTLTRAQFEKLKKDKPGVKFTLKAA